MIGSPFLAGRDRYERVMDGRVDNTHEAFFTHTVRITDSDRSVEVMAVCSPSPGYEVQEVTARLLGGTADPGIAADFPRLAGTPMVGGFTRRVAEVCRVVGRDPARVHQHVLGRVEGHHGAPRRVVELHHGQVRMPPRRPPPTRRPRLVRRSPAPPGHADHA